MPRTLGNPRNPPSIYSEFRSNERIHGPRAYARTYVPPRAWTRARTRARGAYARTRRTGVHMHARERARPVRAHKNAFRISQETDHLPLNADSLSESQRFSIRSMAAGADAALGGGRRNANRTELADARIAIWRRVHQRSGEPWLSRRETVTHLGVHVTVAVSAAYCAPTPPPVSSREHVKQQVF